MRCLQQLWGLNQEFIAAANDHSSVFQPHIAITPDHKMASFAQLRGLGHAKGPVMPCHRRVVYPTHAHVW